MRTRADGDGSSDPSCIARPAADGVVNNGGSVAVGGGVRATARATRRRANSGRTGDPDGTDGAPSVAVDDGCLRPADSSASASDGDEELAVGMAMGSAGTAATAGGRSSRKRQLPARFRDSELEIQPSPRRRRVSEMAASSGFAGGPLRKQHQSHQQQQPVRAEVFDELKLPDRSPSPLPIADAVYLKEEELNLQDTAEIVLKDEEEVVEQVVDIESHRSSALVDIGTVGDQHQSTQLVDEHGVIVSQHSAESSLPLDHCESEPATFESSGLPPTSQSSAPDEQPLSLVEEDCQPPTVDPWPPTSISYVCGTEGHPSADPLAAAAGAFFASDDELDARDTGALAVPSASLDDDDDLIAMEVESLEVPLPSNEEPREPCKVCHRQMKVSQLRQHMLLHAGLRPYKCEVCRAAFTRRSDVFRHVKIVHHQEKPFKCSLDGKEFSDRKSLKLHMEQHKRPVLFACKVCDFRFGKFDSYVNHIKNIHPTGEPIPSFPEEVEPAPEPLAPPRGRHGPKPLEDFVEEDMMNMPCGGYLESMTGGERLQMGSGLESIETEEIPHDSMQLVGSDDHSAVVAAVQQATTNGTLLTLTDDGTTAAAAAAAGVARGADHHTGHMELPVLDDDTAALLGMPDLSLPTSVSADCATSVGHDPGAVELATSSSDTRLGQVTAPASRSTQPRLVTIGKPSLGAGGDGGAGGGMPDRLGGSGQFKTVLLTRPRMVAGRQVLQAVKLSPGQRIVAARVPASSSATASSSSSSSLALSRSAAGATARTPHVIRTTAPRSRPVIPVETSLAASSSSSLSSSSAPVLAAPVVTVAAAAAAGGSGGEVAAPLTTRSIEVTASSADGASRTIVLQTSGEPGADGDILQSKEAMQSLLSAVQQLVAASGDTLEGKQIEIVMQNDHNQSHQ